MITTPFFLRRLRSATAVITTAVAVVVASIAVTSGVDARQVAVAEAEPIQIVEELRFGCRADVVDGQRGVVCRWSEASADGIRGYQLYRIVNGAPRELVSTVANGERRGAFDRDVEPGDHLIYGVVGRNRSGAVVAIGGPVRLALPG